MGSYPRRSARLSSQHLQQEQFQQRSGTLSAPTFVNGFSQPSSASTSSHPSPVTDNMHPPPPPPTPQQPQHRLQIQPNFMSQQQSGQTHMNAPLPSPSAAEMGPFFGRPHSQPNPYAPQQLHPGYQAQQPFGAQQPQQNQQGQSHHLHPHTNSMSQQHPGHAQGMNPGQLPPDFLAEAAKRAQMACLMRDIGDISL
ncbi:hypothetical protein H2200_010144 [Cladophialophora chaetospira]|uniref:Uncharacterized protein n=1 Tax=Cladophialophora chaetospira TaxID=386627 RepID=A0AA38X2C4_9EURO|nr:hypothetical protein H2200_010144 [Cladophialophora chaetospira]